MTEQEIGEHEMVVAVCDIREDGILIPKGATGAVVAVHRSRLMDAIMGYTVEFTEPKHEVISCYRNAVARRGPAPASE